MWRPTCHCPLRRVAQPSATWEHTNGNDAWICWSGRHHDAGAVCGTGPADRASSPHDPADAAGHRGPPPNARGGRARHADGCARVSDAEVVSRRVSGTTPERGRSWFLAGKPEEWKRGKCHAGTEISFDDPWSRLIQQLGDSGRIRHLHRRKAQVAARANQWGTGDGGGAAQGGAPFRSGAVETR